MKKLLFLLLVPFLSYQASAQVAVGLRGTFAGSVLTTFELIQNITPDFKLLPSGSGGVFVEIPANQWFSVQPEVNYSQKGFRIKEGIDIAGQFLGVNIPVNGRFDVRMHYLEVPVLAKFHMGDKEAAHYYLAIGPSVGFLLDADLRMKLLGLFPTTINLNDGMFKSAEFSGVAAVGFELPVAQRLKAFTEVRYTHGFSRSLDTPVVSLDVRSRTIAGSLGLKLSL